MRSLFRTLPPTLATLSCHMSPRKQEARGSVGLGWRDQSGSRPRPPSPHHKAQAQAPKHNSGTSSHLDPGPVDLKRSTPGPPCPSSLIQGTMPFGAQHLGLSRHLTTLMDDTLDHLG